ncbi:uncharacterized protein LOC108135062 [Drosophila elegans]|uniref:uncharacterized protein LOC108135062 n=1 Tax=Drosophila elegans TaxID=30023 RepID=UPI0007E7D92E|nr:uncharacterized protein LOC108135062 [Drosophila elegans]
MNPACRVSLESTECQEWMNEVCAHCAHLLPSAEQAELWDKWWADDLPAPFKNRVNLMTAYDCHKLRKDVARQVAALGDQERYEGANDHDWWSVYRDILMIPVLVSVLIAIVCALRILCNALQRCSTPMRMEYPPPAELKPEKGQTTPSTPTDVVSPPRKDPNKPSKSSKPSKLPKSFISFGRNTDPRTRFGPYKHQKLLKTSSLQELQHQLKAKPVPRPAEKSDQHSEQQSTENKSATK